MAARELGNAGGNPLARARSAGSSRGEVLFAISGTYNWVCPPGVTEVCAVGIGPGGPCTFNYASETGVSGSGGALVWANGIAVTPGTSYTIVVGVPGYPTDGSGGYVASTNTTGLGLTCTCGSPGVSASVGAFSGAAKSTGGGNGGPGATMYNGSQGGGGAGGYSGNGTAGTTTASTAAATGGAASGGGSGPGSGGGVGIFGEGASGAAGTSSGGKGGSGGTDGRTGQTAWPYHTATYGGGMGTTAGGSQGGVPGPGAFRILWGAGRAFPSTDVGYS